MKGSDKKASGLAMSFAKYVLDQAKESGKEAALR